MASLPDRSTAAFCVPRLESGRGVLLVGHGTRDSRGQLEFLQAAAMLRETLRPTPVAECFLELAQPGIAAGVAALAAQGAESLVVLPALLFAAAHAKRDIPEQLAAAVSSLGGMPWKLAPPLDCHERILELSARRFREALAQPPASGRDETLLVLVGRGSADPAAIDRMREFARRRAALAPAAQVLTCFLTGGAPTLDDALAIAASGPCRNIVVQPHLLFHGELIREIRAAAASRARTASQRGSAAQRWTVTAHLGPAPELMAALVDRLALVGHPW